MGAEKSIKRIAVLYARLSGYMAASLKALHTAYDVELLVIRKRPNKQAPFDPSVFSWITDLRDREDLSDTQMRDLVENFGPDGLFISGWSDSGYLKVARHMRKRGIPVVAGSDTQWKGTMRQHLARVVALHYLHPAIDVMWVSGERQRQLAEKLGYTGTACWEGVYTCDWDHFAQYYAPQNPQNKPHFVYVGRLVDVKGLDTLSAAYRRYRHEVADPWELHILGTGPLNGLFDGVEGVVQHGFVQPADLPGILAAASAFVLPSRHEPWGVVIHEAATLGLPIICSHVCGAGVHLVRGGFNGFTFEADNTDDLCSRLKRMSGLPAERLQTLRQNSHALSRQYHPSLWAETIYQGLITHDAEQ